MQVEREFPADADDEEEASLEGRTIFRDVANVVGLQLRGSADIIEVDELTFVGVAVDPAGNVDSRSVIYQFRTTANGGQFWYGIVEKDDIVALFFKVAPIITPELREGAQVVPDTMLGGDDDEPVGQPV